MVSGQWLVVSMRRRCDSRNCVAIYVRSTIYFTHNQFIKRKSTEKSVLFVLAIERRDMANGLYGLVEGLY